MKTFSIPLTTGTDYMSLDAAKLVEGRCLIQGASGSGKSYLVRVIVEYTIRNRLQTIILDPEGEFVTLREKCKVLIAGKGGDVPAEVRSAKLLARQIAETGVSAVVDLSDLKLDDRRQFVRIFLETLDGLPKRLEAARLVVVDEAHRFCPEAGKGSAVSTDAVIALMSQGRKRGLAGMLVTQRLSKLKKDAAAEAGNIFIGRTSPIDLASAQDGLGVTKAERESLRRLKPGHFMVAGPALSIPEPTMLKVRKAITTHPKPGSRHMAKTPPPQRGIAKILKEFEELPPSEEQETAESLAEANDRIRELEKALKKAEKAGVGGARLTALEKQIVQVEREYKQAVAAYDKKVKNLVARIARDAQKTSEHAEAVTGLAQELDALAGPEIVTAKATSNGVVALTVPQTGRTRTDRPNTVGPPSRGGPVEPARSVVPPSGDLPFTWSSAPGKILTVLVQWHPEGLEKRRVAALAGVHFKSSTFRNALTKLRNAGVLQTDTNLLRATAEAAEKYADTVQPLPDGDDLLNGWRGRLGVGVPLGIFNTLIGQGGSGTREMICELAGVDPTKSTARNAFTKLRNFGLLESGSGDLQLTEHVVEAMS